MSLSDLNNDGIALDGMDPVAYRNGDSLLGTAEYSSDLRGITYRFANEENLVLFEADPAMYIPDFAGSYLRDPEAQDTIKNDGTPHGIAPANSRLESRGMLQDEIEPIGGTIDPELKDNPGYETDDEVEMSNLSDSNS